MGVELTEDQLKKKKFQEIKKKNKNERPPRNGHRLPLRNLRIPRQKILHGLQRTRTVRTTFLGHLLHFHSNRCYLRLCYSKFINVDLHYFSWDCCGVFIDYISDKSFVSEESD